MRYFYFLTLFGAALVLQSTIVPLMLPAWLSAGVDLPLLVVIHVALVRGKMHGMLTGIMLGYLQDALTGGILGINAVAKIIAGYAGGYLKEKFFVRNIAHQAASVTGAVFLSIFSKVAVLGLFDQPRPGLLSPDLLWAVTGNSLLALGSHIFLTRFETTSGMEQEELSLGD